MNINSPSVKGLTKTHQRFSFLKTASEGLSQDESDLESLAQEAQYQWELQTRIHKNQERVSRACGGQGDESVEEDSLEETHLSQEGSDEEETQRPSGGQGGTPKNASTSEEIMDEYSELRYNPNWKDSKKGKSFLALEESHQEDFKSSSFVSLDLACCPSQGRFVSTNGQLQERPPKISPLIAGGFWNPCDEPSDGRDGSFRWDEKGREPGVVYCGNSNDSLTNSDSRAQLKEPKPRSEKDFIEKNKLTLGLAAQENNSYLQLHGKKQGEGSQEKAHWSARSSMDRVDSSQAASLEETPPGRSSMQHPLGTQAELRSQLSGDTSSGVSPFPAQAPHLLQHHARTTSTDLTLAGKPLQRDPYHHFPGLLSPCVGERKTCQHSLEDLSGAHHPYSYRCTISEPFTRHGKRWKPLGHKCASHAYNSGQQEPINGAVSSCNPWHIYTEEVPNNYAFDYSGPSQPFAPRPIKRTVSPAARLIQVVEQHHREISQLANAHLARNQLANMFPPIIQRGESDSQLHLESCEEAQPVLSRSNSEGYLLQMEKQKERKEKGNRKGSRAKGYLKMDVRLGGLGPDYETIKEKSEKMKHQKIYAKQINKHNLKNISSARRPQLKTENQAVSRQKALEYAKTIPRPRLFVSRPSEQESKEEKTLGHTLNGDSLPPISSLESLQNRHEKEKQVVAAFKTLHIV